MNIGEANAFCQLLDAINWRNVEPLDPDKGGAEAAEALQFLADHAGKALQLDVLHDRAGIEEWLKWSTLSDEELGLPPADTPIKITICEMTI